MNQAEDARVVWAKTLTDLVKASLPDIRKIIVVSSSSAIIWTFFRYTLLARSSSIFVSVTLGTAVVLSAFLRLPIYRSIYSNFKQILEQNDPHGEGPLIDLICLAFQFLRASLDTISLVVFGLFWLHLKHWYYFVFAIYLARFCVLVVRANTALIRRYLGFSLLWSVIIGILRICDILFSLFVPGPKTEPPPYQYGKLEGRQIRLLKCSKSSLLSRPQYNLCILDLSIFDRKDAPEYDAISYTWDDQAFDRYAIVDGKRLAITRNVECILKQRSSALRETWLWIDAICINQTKTEEKEHQLTLIGQIYSHARRTLIWMNNDGATPSQAIKLLFIFFCMGILKSDFATDEDLIKEITFHLLSPFWLNPLEKFLNHSYWRRVWIIQEIARGKCVHLLYGGFVLDFDYVIESLELMIYPPLDQLLEKNRLILGALEGFGKRSWFKDISNTSSLYNIRVLRSRRLLNPVFSLQSSFNSLAKKERDKIFSLRGLVLDDNDDSSDLAIAIRPDYRCPLPDVFIRLASYLLRPECNPDYIFETAGIGLERDWLKDLPTWVPYWRNRTDKMKEDKVYNNRTKSYGKLDAKQGMPEMNTYKAGGNAPFVFEIIDSKSTKLRLSGVKVSSISDLSEPWNFSGRPITEFYDSCHRVCKEKLPEQYHWSGQPRSEAFWRTIIGDKVRALPSTPYSFPAPVEWAQKYQDWLKSPLGPHGKISDLAYPEETRDTFGIQLLVACATMRFAVTDNKQMALVPTGAKADDMIYVIPGIRHPLLFRSSGGMVDEVQFVGHCYVHGIMEGQWWENPLKEEKLVVI